MPMRLLLMAAVVVGVGSQEYDYQDGDCGLSMESMQTLQRAWLDDRFDLSDDMNAITVLCASGNLGASVGTVVGGGVGAALGWFAANAIGAAFEMSDERIDELRMGMAGAASMAGGALGNKGGRSLGTYVATAHIENNPKVVLKKNCFAVLEVTYSIDDMSEAQLKKRFRTLARLMHPDTPTGSDEKMKELVVCHEIARLHRGFFDPDQGFREKEL
jgi:hypothetical protein